RAWMCSRLVTVSGRSERPSSRRSSRNGCAAAIEENSMSPTSTASNTTAPTQFLQVNGQSYAYRRFGNGSALPLLCLQHFTGTLDNWETAETDALHPST